MKSTVKMRVSAILFCCVPLAALALLGGCASGRGGGAGDAAGAPGGGDSDIRTEVVKYRAGDVEMHGFLAYADVPSVKRPGVLVAPEWMGVNDYARGRAKQLAGMGYVAFVLDPYGGGRNAADPREAAAWSTELKNNRRELRARATAAFDVLRQHPRVDGRKVAAIGYCFGGTTVLELARSGADLAGVVSFHGGLSTDMPAGDGGLKAKVLVCHGAVDPFVKDEEVAAFRNEMEAAKADYYIIVYGGAVHSFTNPDASGRGMEGVAYDEKADRRSWEAMKDFFNETLNHR